MGIRDLIPAWSVVRQLGGEDPLALGRAAQSARQAHLRPRTSEADEVVRSICPYCAVGCGQRVFVKDGEVTQIEGDPGLPHLPRAPLPQGRSLAQLRPESLARIQSEVPQAILEGVGGSRPRHGDGHDRRQADKDSRGDLAG
jgi:hypothetical protein